MPTAKCDGTLAFVTVNIPPIKRMDMENWLWKNRKIRIRGGEPSKLRLSTPHYLRQRDIRRFCQKFDEYKTKAT